MSKKLMILGTQSGSGKSTITAGILRVLSNMGFSVSPFKSQNMALNSFVTSDGEEMGRSQAMQAEAARKKPNINMNPILLKPSKNRGSQLIVKGKAVGYYQALSYRKKREDLVDVIISSLSTVENSSDVVILEGAGSAYEVNLRDGDISNMGMAEIADCPVILVADIDRGGVFASIAGTYWLMREDEKKRVKGVIINKFRGKDGSFDDGVSDIERITGLKVLGVMPFLDIDLEGEDSIDLDKSNISPSKSDTGSRDVYNQSKESQSINIAVLRLPYISNFTDFSPFEVDPRVNLRYTLDINFIENADLTIIPGSKSTIEDLEVLKEKDIDDIIKKKNSRGEMIIGICGGFQMLGEKIIDLDEAESIVKQTDGLGILDINTEFFQTKELKSRKYRTDGMENFIGFSGLAKRVHDRDFVSCEEKTSVSENRETSLNEDKTSVMEQKEVSEMDDRTSESDNKEPSISESNEISGYEIHMGRSFATGKDEDLLFQVSNEKNVFGTYIHGLFENDDIREILIYNIIKDKYGEVDMTHFGDKHQTYSGYKDGQFEKLAFYVEKYIDINEILKILDLDETRRKL